MSAPSPEGYRLIAPEYYADTHETCRNFEAATDHFFAHNLEWLRADPIDMALDIGSGGGLSTRYLGDHARTLVEIDFSREMLDQSDNEARVQGNALELPFKDESFERVTAFLFDPYNKTPLENEIYRILKPGGSFIGTTPSWDWASSLRYISDIDLNQTRFHLDRTGDEVLVPSYAYPPEELDERFKDAGFTSVDIEPMYPKPQSPISRHVQLAARLLKLDPEKLEIVSLVKAEK